MLSVDDLKKLTPAWWGAIAGAMAAGATLFPDHRLLAGAGAGVAMFFVARKLTSPCCAACAAAEGAGVEDPEVTRPSPRLVPFSAGLDEDDAVPLASSAAPTAPCLTCGDGGGGIARPPELLDRPLAGLSAGNPTTPTASPPLIGGLGSIGTRLNLPRLRLA